eukprot:2223797-Rhodomonas_salina.1
MTPSNSLALLFGVPNLDSKLRLNQTWRASAARAAADLVAAVERKGSTEAVRKHTHTQGHAVRNRDRETERPIGSQTDSQTDSQERERERQRERQTVRQSDSQTQTHSISAPQTVAAIHSSAKRITGRGLRGPAVFSA